MQTRELIGEKDFEFSAGIIRIVDDDLAPLGVQLVINPDAHSTEELGLLPYGVDVARRGWLEKKDVFNTLTAAQVARGLAAKQKDAG